MFYSEGCEYNLTCVCDGMTDAHISGILDLGPGLMFTQMVGKHGELDTAQADRGQIPILHILVN